MIDLSARRDEMNKSGLYGVIDLAPIDLLDDIDLHNHQTGKISDRDLVVYCYVINMLRLGMVVNADTVTEVTDIPRGSVARSLNQLRRAGMLKNK
jgi:hypothetical protein